MKHIFKKLHHPNRSNDAQSTSSAASSSSPAAVSSPSSSSTASCATDHRNSSSVSQSPSSPSSTSPAAAVTAAGGGNISPINRQQDYYTSEEEYQVQLALALSVSSSQAQESFQSDVNSTNGQILGGGGRNAADLARDREDAAADLLSKQYWLVVLGGGPPVGKHMNHFPSVPTYNCLTIIQLAGPNHPVALAQANLLHLFL